jgi:D-alanyl-D-alanine carboxypeptidase
MGNIALLLVILRFFTGAIDSSQQQLFSVFNIFNQNYSATDFASSLNYLIGPIRNISVANLELNTRAAIVIDLSSDRVLYAKNADDRLPMASITKIMTALVALDSYNNRLNTVITVPIEATEVTGSKMSLYAGEQLTAHNLLKGTLIESANDAGMTLAYAISGTPEQFAVLMNQKAQELGLTDTNFTNPIGFDNDNHYSTAKDLAELTRVAMDNKIFASIVSTQTTTVKDVTGKFVHKLVTTNKLLGQYQNVIGVKTGTTEEAGESLVAAVRGDSGQIVVAVLLDSPNRFQEGMKALDWALKAYSWIEPL